jgi:ketosteroid isomerase-like protein
VAFGGGRDEQTSTNALTDASAKAAIQDYLDALTDGDAETVARHTLCGLFDAVKERRSDMALARLSSDAFRKQYESAEVTAIDKMVQSSPTQAQVLFTMRVIPASGSSRNQPDEAEEQAVAQLLSIDDEVLVCSYLPRTAGQY